MSTFELLTQIADSHTGLKTVTKINRHQINAAVWKNKRLVPLPLRILKEKHKNSYFAFSVILRITYWRGRNWKTSEFLLKLMKLCLSRPSCWKCLKAMNCTWFFSTQGFQSSERHRFIDREGGRPEAAKKAVRKFFKSCDEVEGLRASVLDCNVDSDFRK